MSQKANVKNNSQASMALIDQFCVKFTSRMDYILVLGRQLGKSALVGRSVVFVLKVNLLETVHRHLCFQSWHESDTWAAAVVPDIVHVHLDPLDAGMFFYLMYTDMVGIVGCMVQLASANEIVNYVDRLIPFTFPSTTLSKLIIKIRYLPFAAYYPQGLLPFPFYHF